MVAQAAADDFLQRKNNSIFTNKKQVLKKYDLGTVIQLGSDWASHITVPLTRESQISIWLLSQANELNF